MAARDNTIVHLNSLFNVVNAQKQRTACGLEVRQSTLLTLDENDSTCEECLFELFESRKANKKKPKRTKEDYQHRQNELISDADLELLEMEEYTMEDSIT